MKQASKADHMRAAATAILVLIVGLFTQGCAVIPSVEPTDLSSVREETATRSEVQTALGEPDLSRAADEGRIDVYLFDRGAEAHVFFVPTSFFLWWPITLVEYKTLIERQESYLTVIYDKQDRVVRYGTWPNAETPEDAYERHFKLEEECNLPYSKAIKLDAATQLQVARSCEERLYLYEVANWLRCLAARTGNGAFKRRLGMRNRDSAEPTKDFIQAYKWFSLAVAEGERSALWSRDHLARQMSEDDISKAERLVAEWNPNPAVCETIAAQAGE